MDKNLWYRPSSKRPRIDCINIDDTHPKDPDTQKSSVFQKSEKKWKKIAKTPLFFKHFQKIEIVFYLSQIHHLLSYS